MSNWNSQFLSHFSHFFLPLYLRSFQYSIMPVMLIPCPSAISSTRQCWCTYFAAFDISICIKDRTIISPNIYKLYLYLNYRINQELLHSLICHHIYPLYHHSSPITICRHGAVNRATHLTSSQCRSSLRPRSVARVIFLLVPPTWSCALRSASASVS